MTASQLHLCAQIAALLRSEQSQRDRAQAATAPQPSLPQALPDGRKERIALWRRHGMTQEQADWLRANPNMIDRADLTAVATGLAEQEGYQPNDPLYLHVVTKYFHGLTEHEEQQQRKA